MKRLVTLSLIACLVMVFDACGGDSQGGGGGGLSSETLPEIEAHPSSLTFNPIPPGTTQTIDVEIQNVGSGDDLVIYDRYIQDSGAPFTITGPEINPLALGTSDTIRITYTPTSLVTEATALVVSSNAAGKPLLTIPITVGASNEDIVVAPNPVNFGDVLGGQSRIETVTITNLSKDIEIANIFVKIGSSLDFALTYKPDLPVVLGATQEVTTDVAYTPTGFDGDDGFLVIAIKEEGTQFLIEIPMHGQEVGPEINVSPAKIEFGWVVKGDTEAVDVMLHNMGQHDLNISDLYFSQPGNADLAIADGPSPPFSVPAGGNQKVTVSWNPQTFFEPTSDPIGGFVIKSNDADEALVNIPIYGNIDAPSIRLIPADQVNFGIVAQNYEAPRTLTIENVGHAPLTVFSMEIVENSPLNEFTITADPDFGPTDGTGDGMIFMNTEEETHAVDVELIFTNSGPAMGQEAGVLKIVSDDPITPELFVDLVAQRTDVPECEIAFAPNKLNFGVVAHGAEKVMAINVINAGSGPCSWKSGKITKCDSFLGMMNICMADAGPSQNFFPLGLPIPMQDGMPAGTAQPIQIKYVPPTSIPWIPIFETYIAALQVTYTEPFEVPGVYTEHKFPMPDLSGQIQWNVYGESGIADIAVLPGEVEFGLVTIGCLSQTFILKVYNAGTAPLQVTDIYPDPACGPEFIVLDYPALPTDVQPSAFIEVEVAYLPQLEGVKQCSLIVESSDLDTPVYHVPMKGEGTYETEQTDFFTQIDGKKVDLLFIIDESASMCGEQDNLADNFGYLMEKAALWSNDYQLGIVTTNITDEEYVGKLVGQPRIINKQTVSAFAGNVTDVGCGGSGTQESGLEGARRAITPPLAYDEEIACACGQDDPCAQSCSAGFACVGGGCGGHNRGFIRPDAALEIIFVSDEEDQSPGSVPFYIDFFKSIKGVMNEGLFHAHAIVGDKSGGCNGGATEDGADAGKRYIDVQEATGGIWHSICDDSFAAALENIGDVAFGAQVQFFLSAQADPNNVKVWVDSGGGFQECLSGWYYDPASNAVIFDETGPCMPQANDQIKIWYQMICNSL
ncbi:MAG: choice-of-anchor D domain-containing protein [Pseudomonadota bacterium]